MILAQCAVPIQCERSMVHVYTSTLCVTGSGEIQHFGDSIKIEILLYLASITSELQVAK